MVSPDYRSAGLIYVGSQDGLESITGGIPLAALFS